MLSSNEVSARFFSRSQSSRFFLITLLFFANLTTILYVPGETYELEVVAHGSVLEIWIDGSPIFIVEDVSFSPQAGLRFTPGAIVATTLTMSM